VVGGSSPDGQFGNQLLDSLDPADQRRLEPALTRRQVDLRDLLYRGGATISTVYFPVNAVISILTSMQEGPGVEIATIGNEGMVGHPLFLGSETMPAREFSQVQVPGEVLSMEAAAFQGLIASDGSVREVIQRYVQALFSQVSQQVACNGLHSVEERCSRRLLLTHDRVQSDEFPLTQEFLSQMLGVRRASVTLAARALQKAGFIEYRRGRLKILDRAGLEQASCECYQLIRDEFDRLLGPSAGAG
jgi:CRP-like cAMP-binding protein